MDRLRDFEAMTLPHMDAAFNLANWLVRNRSDAEDIVQDAYLRAFRAFDRVTGDDIKPWLLTIVRNVAYRWLSNRKRAGNVIPIDDALNGRDDDTVLEIASDTPSAESVLIGRAEQALVRAALEDLPPAFREIVILREMEELSYREISKIAGIPIGTVMSRLARTRDQLRQRLTAMMAKENKHAL